MMVRSWRLSHSFRQLEVRGKEVGRSLESVRTLAGFDSYFSQKILRDYIDKLRRSEISLL